MVIQAWIGLGHLLFGLGQRDHKLRLRTSNGLKLLFFFFLKKLSNLIILFLKKNSLII